MNERTDAPYESWVAKKRAERAPADLVDRVLAELDADAAPPRQRSLLELCACAAALLLGLSRFAYLAFVARLIG